MAERVRIFEVGPRDGLQNEARIIPALEKIALVDRLSACGFSHIEVTSFVSPKWVPQMADAAEVLAGISRKSGVVYSALTPNLRGYDAAIAAGATEVAIFASASEGFSRKNINCSIKESFERFSPIISAATADNVQVRGYVSCVTDCPFDGPTAPGDVAEVAGYLCDAGCYEVSLGDTVGAGTPDSIRRMLDAVLKRVPADRIAGHYHDTNDRALDNIAASLTMGVRVFDSSIAGLGGCPYAPGAKGNVDTVAVATLLERNGYDTGLDREMLVAVAEFARSLRGNANAV